MFGVAKHSHHTMYIIVTSHCRGSCPFVHRRRRDDDEAGATLFHDTPSVSVAGWVVPE